MIPWLLAIALGIGPLMPAHGQINANPKPNLQEARFSKLAIELSAYPPGNCVKTLSCGRVYDLEKKLFKATADAVLDALRAKPKDPKEPTTALLQKLKLLGDEALRGWPSANRFHFKTDFSKTAGGWESFDLVISVRTEDATASYDFRPEWWAYQAKTTSGWKLDGVSSRGSGEPIERFSVVARKLVQNPPEDCGGPMKPAATEDAAIQAEDQMFSLLGDAALGAIKKAPDGASQKAALAALKPFQDVTNRIAASWPADKRLRYNLLPIRPLLVLTLSIWNQDTFMVFAPPSHGAGSSPSWQIAQNGSMDWSGHAPFEDLQVFPLWRGPSGDPRFLVVKHFQACMAGQTLGSVADGYEWTPGDDSMTKIVESKSEVSEKGPPWQLRVSGKVVGIPYCWSGPLQFSVWAPICSLDTYDLSGNTVRYIGTKNSPEDLALVAKVVKYAESHDSVALRGYCVSAKLAYRISEVMPPQPYFDGFERKNIRPGQELLELDAESGTMKFTLEKTPAGWLITGFQFTN